MKLALILITVFSVGCTSVSKNNKNSSTATESHRSIASETTTLTKLPPPIYNPQDKIPRFFDRHVSRVAKLENNDLYIDIAFSGQDTGFGILYIAFDHSSGNCRDASSFDTDVYEVYINYGSIKSARLEGSSVVVTGDVYDSEENTMVERTFAITLSPNSAPVNVENEDGRTITNCSGAWTPAIPADIINANY